METTASLAAVAGGWTTANPISQSPGLSLRVLHGLCARGGSPASGRRLILSHSLPGYRSGYHAGFVQEARLRLKSAISLERNRKSRKRSVKTTFACTTQNSADALFFMSVEIQPGIVSVRVES